MWKAGEPVSLSPTEFTLLRYFMVNAGTVLSKPKILDHVWRYDFGGDVGVVESYVSYLRRKVDTGPQRLIHTLRGVGYVMRDDRGMRKPAVMRWLRGIPLRVTLVAALVVMTAVGLLVSGIAVTSAIEQSLLNRTDRPVVRGVAELGQTPTGAEPAAAREHPGPRPAAERVLRPDRGRRRHGPHGRRTTPKTSPTSPRRSVPTPITVDSLGASEVQWRALSTSNVNGTTTVAIKLTENEEVVTRLVVLQSIIGAFVLLALGIASYFVIRGSLRPLREVEETAAAIAGGDLNRRVPERGTNTEVDHLSIALNSMLTQIEQAFAATEASEESARRSEEKMRRFVADASHELRTPLTTIRGFAELYRQGAAPDTDMVIGRIEGEASRMGVLVEDLLMLARLDAQRPIEREPVDLLALASDAVHNARAIAPERPISLEVRGNDAADTLGDPR